jgi:hypothetical protein
MKGYRVKRLGEYKMASVDDVNRRNSKKTQEAFAAAKLVLIYRHFDTLSKKVCSLYDRHCPRPLHSVTYK